MYSTETSLCEREKETEIHTFSKNGTFFSCKSNHTKNSFFSLDISFSHLLTRYKSSPTRFPLFYPSNHPSVLNTLPSCLNSLAFNTIIPVYQITPERRERHHQNKKMSVLALRCLLCSPLHWDLSVSKKY